MFVRAFNYHSRKAAYHCFYHCHRSVFLLRKSGGVKLPKLMTWSRRAWVDSFWVFSRWDKKQRTLEWPDHNPTSGFSSPLLSSALLSSRLPCPSVQVFLLFSYPLCFACPVSSRYFLILLWRQLFVAVFLSDLYRVWNISGPHSVDGWKYVCDRLWHWLPERVIHWWAENTGC